MSSAPISQLTGDALSFMAVLGREMRAVDEVIRSHLHSDVALIRQVSEYIISSGGKRLRPGLVVLSAGAFGYGGRAVYEMAAAVEFIHTATLLHDDVVDGSGMRRGQAAAHSLFGNAASVLVGDFLYSRAFQMMVAVGNMKVLEVLADATNTIAEGEVLQLLNCRNPDVEEAGYFQVIRCKTAKLFDAAGRIGAILSGAGKMMEQRLGDYGMALGTAYQLADDVLDYSGDAPTIGKNLGDDLAEGKVTLPLIHALRNGTPAEADVIRRAIREGGAEEFEPVLQAIRSTGALDYALDKARTASVAASAAVAALPHTLYKDCLLELATFAATRSY